MPANASSSDRAATTRPATAIATSEPATNPTMLHRNTLQKPLPLRPITPSSTVTTTSAAHQAPPMPRRYARFTVFPLRGPAEPSVLRGSDVQAAVATTTWTLSRCLRARGNATASSPRRDLPPALKPLRGLPQAGSTATSSSAAIATACNVSPVSRQAPSKAARRSRSRGVGVTPPGRAITMTTSCTSWRDTSVSSRRTPSTTSPTPAPRVVRQTDRLEQVEVGVAQQQVGGAL